MALRVQRNCCALRMPSGATAGFKKRSSATSASRKYILALRMGGTSLGLRGKTAESERQAQSRARSVRSSAAPGLAQPPKAGYVRTASFCRLLAA